MTKGSFKHALGSTVTLEASNESGKVVGRAEYDNSENAYLVRYVAADGRQTEAWWNESAVADIA